MYTLWDLKSGNAIGEFFTPDDALAAVRELIEAWGEDEAESLAMEYPGPERSIVTIEGKDLINDALTTTPGR